MTRARVLGVVIANGFSSEARVFSNLLSARADQYDALVLHHTSSHPHVKDEGALEQFAEASAADIAGFDAGWRRNDDGRRRIPSKAASWAKLHLSLPRLLSIARRFRPTVVYSSQQRWDCHVASLLALVLRVPQVIHLHYRVVPSLGRSVLTRLRQVPGLVCISDYIRAEALDHGVRPERARTIHNTLSREAVSPLPRTDARNLFGLPQAGAVFVSAARLEREKGHIDTVRAFARVHEHHPEARLLIAGDGKLRDELQEVVRALSLSSVVTLLGHRRDVSALLNAADVFCHPSTFEPFGLAILEASAAGLPTIAYRDGGPKEIIVHDEGGLLVPPSDIDALANAMLALARDTKLARSMGLRARDDLEARFNPRTIAPRFGGFLEEISSRRS